MERITAEKLGTEQEVEAAAGATVASAVGVVPGGERTEVDPLHRLLRVHRPLQTLCLIYQFLCLVMAALTRVFPLLEVGAELTGTRGWEQQEELGREIMATFNPRARTCNIEMRMSIRRGLLREEVGVRVLELLVAV